jgi:glutamate dehydrogenase
MTSKRMAPSDRARLIDNLSTLLCQNALPGELAGFEAEDRRAAAEFVSDSASKRMAGTPMVRIESSGAQGARRIMRICIANDDMPFLVDSVAQAIAARGLIIHRLLHPVIRVERDANGVLISAEPLGDDKGRRESLMYIEVDRADARERAELADELLAALKDVRAAVEDWPKLRAQLRADAAAIDDPETRALLEWFAGGAMTLLGYQRERPGQPSSNGLGLFREPSPPDDEGGCDSAIAWLEKSGEDLIAAKAERKSSVHRRVPLDLLAVPIREKGKITGIGVHAGLWTSDALSASVDDVPFLRERLETLESKLGFDPSGHSGKALRHAFSSLPHDLLVNLDEKSVKTLALTAMSLADRPRPWCWSAPP